MLQEVTDAGEAFEQLVAAYANNRAEFDAMIAPYADPNNAITLSDRRAAFRVNSRIWGVQADTQLKCSILNPNQHNPAMLDAALISGGLNLRQLRRTAPLVLSRYWVTDEAQEQVLEGFVREPLDPTAASEHGVAALGQFCSETLNVKRVIESSGIVRTEIMPSDVGIRGSVDYFEGNVVRNAGSRYRTDTDRHGHYNVLLHVPCESVIIDHLVHRDTHRVRTAPEFIVYDEHTGAIPFHGLRDEHDRLPITERFTHLGTGLSSTRTPKIPKYVELLRGSFHQLGWDPEEFDVFRCVFEYPVIPCTSVTRFELHDPPESSG